MSKKKVYHCVATIRGGRVVKYHSCTADEDRAYSHMGLLRRGGRTDVGMIELDMKPLGVKAPPKSQGPVQGKLFDDDPGQDLLFGLDDATPTGRKLLDIRAKQVAQVMPHELPEHVKPFAEFMVRQSKKPINARDIVKAYAITVASVQRSHILDETARYGSKAQPEGGWPGHPGKVGFRVRPEDFMAYLLVSTKAGHQYLNAAERGQIDEQARDSMLKRFPWGLRPTLKKQLTYAATTLAPKTSDIAHAIRARRGPWVRYVLRNIKGVGPAKVGFFSALIGRGDNATADARQLNFWFCPPKKWNIPKGSCTVPPVRPKEATPAIIEELNKRMRALKISMPDRYKPFYEHLAHHAAWDAIGHAKTTHRPMIKAMELAGPRKRR